MIELLFIACLVSEPEHCEKKALLFSEISPHQCMMGAQPQLAQWTNQHPKWRVKNWRCQTVSLAERDA